MSGPGPIVVKPSGSITAPSALAPSLSTALSQVLSRVALPDVILFPSLKAVAVANGYDFQYHLLDGAQYLTGPIGPYTAPTVTPTAVRATSVLTITTNPNVNDIIFIQGSSGVITLVFDTTVYVATSTSIVVKIGAAISDTITNIQKAFNGTGTNGTEYYDGASVGYYGSYRSTYWSSVQNIEISAVNTGAGTATFQRTVYGTIGNNASYPYVFVGGARMAFGGTFAGGTAGTGTDPGPGTFDYAYARVRKADSAITAVSTTATLDTGANSNVTVSAFQTPPTRDGVDFTRVYRTTDVGSELLPVIDGSSPLVDTLSDVVLDRDGQIPYDANITRDYAAGYPDRYRYHCTHLGCVFGIGAIPSAKQNTGTASVTKWDYTAANALTAMSVTLSAGTPTALWIGRTFRVTADEIRYGIVEVDATTRVITLNTPYIGATNATAAYEVLDERDPNTITHSEPLLINNRPFEDTIDGVTSEDPRGGTGIRSMWGSLVAFTQTGAFQIRGDTTSGFTIPGRMEGTGAFCQRAIVQIVGSAADSGSLLWIGANGVFGWNGAGYPTNISNPAAQSADEVRGIEQTIRRINPLASDGIVSNYNPSLKVARWAVPVDGSMWNNLIIQYSLQTKAFTFLGCDGITAFDTIAGPSGYVTVAGDMYRQFWQMDTGYSDGAYGFETVQTATAYATATNKVTVSGTPFPTTSGGLIGVPVLSIGVDGVIERNTVAANTSSTLTFVAPFTTAPNVGGQIVVGGIFWRMKTTEFSLGAADIRKTVSSLFLGFTPATSGQIWVAVSVDGEDPLCFALQDGGLDYVDMTAETGAKYLEMRRGPGRTMRIELFAVAPGFDLSVSSLAWTVRSREEAPR